MMKMAWLLVLTGCGSGEQAAPMGGDDMAKTGGMGDMATAGGMPDLSKAPAGALPADWLYTNGNKIYSSDGNGGGSVWMGRGVNVDDIFFCGYNNTLWMTTPDQTFETMVTAAITQWKATFLRVSLSMNSNMTKASWLSNPAQYQTPMTNAVKAVGAHPNVHILVTLRSDSTMNETDANNEATYVPTNNTDDVYRGLVDSFAHDGFVIFGLCNEPGTIQFANLAPLMSHAVGVIRAEEDKLGVPHHLISVQGRQWTSDISYYATNPIASDNIVYEIHGYPPMTASYTYANLPVIIGEYGSLSNASNFFADLEAKQIPSLAWDFQAFSDCAPDLLNVTHDATQIQPNSWGNTVMGYLQMH